MLSAGCDNLIPMTNSTIKQKTGPCIDCGDDRPLTAGRCGWCYKDYRAGICQERAKAKGKSTHIPAKSAKQLERDIAYAKAAKEWKKTPRECQAKLPGCTRIATQIHHKEGRDGHRLLDQTTWLAVCHNCHNGPKGITEDSKGAIEKGLSLRRNT